jgi:hypothetical protein
MERPRSIEIHSSVPTTMEPMVSCERKQAAVVIDVPLRLVFVDKVAMTLSRLVPAKGRLIHLVGRISSFAVWCYQNTDSVSEQRLFFVPCRFSVCTESRKFLSEPPSVLDKTAQDYLRTATLRTKSSMQFKCLVFGSEWDQFVENWMPTLYGFIKEALGPFGREPLPTILKLPDGMHMSGATASFNMGSGQIHLSTSVEGNPGQTLEKLTHELLHGSLAQFPDGDPYYEEGAVDYSTWVLAHAPIYSDLRDATVAAAEFNIKMRRERAMRDLSDYDRKRWAGGVFYHFAHGPMILHKLRMRKAEGNFTW